MSSGSADTSDSSGRDTSPSSEESVTSSGSGDDKPEDAAKADTKAAKKAAKEERRGRKRAATKAADSDSDGGSSSEEESKDDGASSKRRRSTRAKRKPQVAESRPAGYNKPPDAEVLEETHPIPKKNKHGELVFDDHPEFRPNLTPSEVIQRGSFGGGYFRSIKSSVTGETYSGVYKEFPAEWWAGLNIKTQLTSASYREGVNRYGKKCGGDLEMWESSGWISAIDPYGWFQWYCRFYQGRRSTDDERQISRGLGVMGPKGRFRNQLIGKCSREHKAFDDRTVSPVIRQSLQHWGYVLTKRDADAYIRKKGLASLPE